MKIAQFFILILAFHTNAIWAQSAADSYGMDVLLNCLNKEGEQSDCAKKAKTAIKNYERAQSLSESEKLKKTLNPQESTSYKPSFFYHLQGNDTFKVYDSAKGTQPVTELEADSFIPFKGISSNRAVLETAEGKNLYVEIKGQKTSQVSAASNIPVYLDRPKGEVVTLFSTPGMNWRDCDYEPLPELCKGRMWPRADADTKLYVTDTQMIYITDPETGVGEHKLFYKVNGSYKANSTVRKIEGLWVAAEDVRNSPLTTSEVDIVAPQKPKVCPPNKKTEIEKKSKEILEAVVTAHQKLNEDFVNDLINKGQVGSCLKNRKSKLPKNINNPFNSYMKPFWQKQLSKDSKVSFEGKKISQQELFAIDSLARTLFTEMRGCVNKGLRYPMSVARVALNRAYYSRDFAKKNKGNIKGLSFVKDSSSGIDGKTFDYRSAPIEETLTRVISASGQFSAWNANDPNVHLALCPENLRSQDQNAWKKSVQIAAQAILRRNDFKNITKEVKAHHYSSNMTPSWANSKKLERNVKVGGLPVDSMKCIKLWSDNSSQNHDWQAWLDQYNFDMALNN